ncbi:hypothetical protein HYD59_03595 [Mycoplasmopsis bovis]|nr:hypothetical protein [Mycoplasmopsis bovis]QQH61059.1 hypothetical protein HYD59_03595 [Mycoplasmopsis bovis]
MMIQCNVDKTTDAKKQIMKSRNQLLHQKINQMNLDLEAGKNDNDNSDSRTKGNTARNA